MSYLKLAPLKMISRCIWKKYKCDAKQNWNDNINARKKLIIDTCTENIRNQNAYISKCHLKRSKSTTNSENIKINANLSLFAKFVEIVCH